MNHCNVGRMGALFIAEGLGGSQALTSLSLAHNNILDFGAEKISASFSDDMFNIQYLNLAGNNLTDKGGTALTKVMLRNKTLKSIDLRHNDLTMKTANLMKPVLLNNSNLRKVHLEQNIIKICMLQQLAALCAKNVEKNEAWDLRTLKKDVKTERKGGVVVFNSPELLEYKDKVKDLPQKDQAFQVVHLQIEEAKDHSGIY